MSLSLPVEDEKRKITHGIMAFQIDLLQVRALHMHGYTPIPGTYAYVAIRTMVCLLSFLYSLGIAEESNLPHTGMFFV